MEITKEELAEMLKVVVQETVSSTIAAMKGPNGDPWDNVDQATVDKREADMERAKAERLAAIEAENAVIAERLRWQNMDPAELKLLEEEAAHKRYAEAVANSVLMGKDPVKEDFSALVEGLDPLRVEQELAKVAATMAALPEIEIAPNMKVDGAKIKASIDKVDLHASIAVDRGILDKKSKEKERV